MRSAHALSSPDGFRSEEGAAGGATESLEDKRARLRALRKIQFGAESFEAFVFRVQPLYYPVPNHLRPLYNLIERSRHEQVRALVSMPPRHGKTETLRYALAWRCLYDPAVQNAYATYGADLSEETGLRVRSIAASVGVQVGKVASNSNAGAGTAKVHDWRTSMGGGLKSTSVGGSITGRGVNGLMIVDDPIKGREAADSLAERDRVWKWFRSDIWSRREGGCSCIIVQTRWHEDDPIGRMTSGGGDWSPGFGEEWEYINLPAVGDGLGNAVDEKDPKQAHRAKPLWSSVDSRYPQNDNAAMRWYASSRASGEYEWWSLYQGVPRALDRKPFGEEPATYVLPIRFHGARAMMMMDPAAKAKTSSDFSALGAFAMRGYGDRVVEAMDRKGRLMMLANPDPAVMDVIEIFKDRRPVPAMIDLAYEWQRTKYPRLRCGIEVDGTGSNLPDVVQRVQPKLRITEVSTGGKDKYTRSIPASKAWYEGRIRVPSDKDESGQHIVIGWDVVGYIRVMKAFTGLGDPEDDVVDITTHAWNRMYRPWNASSRQQVRAPASY